MTGKEVWVMRGKKGERNPPFLSCAPSFSSHFGFQFNLDWIPGARGFWLIEWWLVVGDLKGWEGLKERCPTWGENGQESIDPLENDLISL